MHPLVRTVIAFAVGFVAASAVVGATHVAEDARAVTPDEEVVGELDFFEYCRAVGGARVSAVQVSTDAFGWRCVSVRNGVPGYDEVDVDEACRLRFGDTARARTDNPSSAYSWRCVTPVAP